MIPMGHPNVHPPPPTLLNNACSAIAEVPFMNPEDSTIFAANPVESELKSLQTASSH
jgi:hypothetical protein